MPNSIAKSELRLKVCLVNDVFQSILITCREDSVLRSFLNIALQKILEGSDAHFANI